MKLQNNFISVIFDEIRAYIKLIGLNGNKNKAFDNNELLKLLKELKKDLTLIVHDQKSTLNPEERFQRKLKP